MAAERTKLWLFFTYPGALRVRDCREDGNWLEVRACRQDGSRLKVRARRQDSSRLLASISTVFA
jgi:hypothetical protein